MCPVVSSASFESTTVNNFGYVLLPDQNSMASGPPLLDAHGFSAEDLVEVSAFAVSSALVSMQLQCMLITHAGLGQGVLDEERFIQHPKGL